MKEFNGDIVIELNSISKYYQNIKALSEVSVKIPSGAVGLLGPNGAGKTTLIKTILGLVSYQTGQAKVLGFDIRTQSREIRQNIGYVPEDECYIVGLTGVEFVRYAGELYGMQPSESLRRTHETLDYVGVIEERYRPVQTYSTGMKQKVKLAQSLICNPKLLILDEPTSGLDPDARNNMLQIIKTLATKKNISILYSTHILHDVEQVCDYIVIIGKGKILASDYLKTLQIPVEKSYKVRLFGNIENFIKELTSPNFVIQPDEKDTILIKSKEDDAVNRILETASKCSVQVREVLQSKTSLEEIFIKAVGE